MRAGFGSFKIRSSEMNGWMDGCYMGSSLYQGYGGRWLTCTPEDVPLTAAGGIMCAYLIFPLQLWWDVDHNINVGLKGQTSIQLEPQKQKVLFEEDTGSSNQGTCASRLFWPYNLCSVNCVQTLAVCSLALENGMFYITWREFCRIANCKQTQTAVIYLQLWQCVSIGLQSGSDSCFAYARRQACGQKGLCVEKHASWSDLQLMWSGAFFYL